MNERQNELQVLIASAEQELKELQEAAGALYPGSAPAKENEATQAGVRKQLEDFRRQLAEITDAERRAEEARREAEALEQRRREEAEQRAEAERRKEEEAERQRRIEVEREKARQEREKAEREAAEERAREAERIAKLRRKQAEKEAAEKAKQQEEERLAALGTVLKAVGMEANRFRLETEDGGIIEVRYFPPKVEA